MTYLTDTKYIMCYLIINFPMQVIDVSVTPTRLSSGWTDGDISREISSSSLRQVLFKLLRTSVHKVPVDRNMRAS
jgi:hypothetical protein